MHHLDSAVSIAGGVNALALAVGVSPSLPSMWRARGTVPADNCPAIERATSGRVSCEELRPDVRWHRVPDADWPHPGGRPLIDVAAPKAQKEAA